jgi:hypothetical protein
VKRVSSELESPFLDEELFVARPSLEQRHEINRVVEASPFVNWETLDETRGEGFEAEERDGEDALTPDELEAWNDEEDAAEAQAQEADPWSEDEEPEAEEDTSSDEYADTENTERSDDETWDEAEDTFTEPVLAEAGSEERPSVTVILDQPAEADDTFKLVGSHKSYTKTLDASAAQALVTGQRLLRFEGVKANKSYQLLHQRSKKSARIIFLETRFQDLAKAGIGPHEAKYTYITLSSQAPKELRDPYGKDAAVDAALIAKSPRLVDLEVEDPEL